jgi:hypothetical protein
MRNIHAWAEAFDRRDDLLDAGEDVSPMPRIFIGSPCGRRFQLNGSGPSAAIQAFYPGNRYSFFDYRRMIA